MWGKFERYAYVCRFGRQSITELLGRPLTALEFALFEKAIQNLVSEEYKPITPNEDD